MDSGSSEAAFAATNGSSLPKVPKSDVPLKFTQEYPSSVIKGCWQLSGGHKGDPRDDRTSKDKGAVEDFETFVNAGINTFDTGPAACGYGDSELVIGDFFETQSKQRTTVSKAHKVVLRGKRTNRADGEMGERERV